MASEFFPSQNRVQVMDTLNMDILNMDQVNWNAMCWEELMVRHPPLAPLCRRKKGSVGTHALTCMQGHHTKLFEIALKAVKLSSLAGMAAIDKALEEAAKAMAVVDVDEQSVHILKQLNSDFVKFHSLTEIRGTSVFVNSFLRDTSSHAYAGVSLQVPPSHTIYLSRATISLTE